MKRAGVLAVLICLLSGCGAAEQEVERGMALRAKILQAQACSFDAGIVADYGEKLHTYSVSCQADGEGNLAFTVTEPETISGIAGKITDTGGKLTFEDTALQFDTMTDDQISPVSAPWIFMKTLRSGCLTSACVEGDRLRLSIDDSYEDDALHLDIWLDASDIPTRAEIVYAGRRILSLDVTNFQIL